MLEKIPRKVFYCWFGGKQKPPIVQRCIDSWKRHLPTYEIVEINEQNFDINYNRYAKQAYENGKYAFVTDYVRVWLLYHCGGIYMDADVEVHKPLDRFLIHRAFTGHETDDLMVTAVMGAEKGHPWIGRLLNYYNTAVFDRMTPNTNIITDLSRDIVERHIYGFRYLQDGVVIYPVDTFCGFDHTALKPIITDNSYASHLFAGTWKGRTIV